MSNSLWIAIRTCLRCIVGELEILKKKYHWWIIGFRQTGEIKSNVWQGSAKLFLSKSQTGLPIWRQRWLDEGNLGVFSRIHEQERSKFFEVPVGDLEVRISWLQTLKHLLADRRERLRGSLDYRPSSSFSRIDGSVTRTQFLKYPLVLKKKAGLSPKQWGSGTIHLPPNLYVSVFGSADYEFCVGFRKVIRIKVGICKNMDK